MDEESKTYDEARRQSVSLHVILGRIEAIMELHDPDDPEISDMKYVYNDLKKFKEDLLRTIGENANLVWYIDQSRKQKE